MTLLSLTKYDPIRESRGCSINTTVMLGKTWELLCSAMLKVWDIFPCTRLTECSLRQHLQYIVVKRRFYLKKKTSIPLQSKATQRTFSVYLCLDACKSDTYQVYSLLITHLVYTNKTIQTSHCLLLF